MDGGLRAPREDEALSILRQRYALGEIAPRGVRTEAARPACLGGSEVEATDVTAGQREIEGMLA